MSYIIEGLLSIIFKGKTHSLSDKRIPVFFRILTAVLSLAVYLGFGGWLIYTGIKTHDQIIIIIAVFILAMIAWIVARKYKELKNPSR